MKAVILCGGKGSRIRDVSEVIPKPMLPIAERPILWHIMKGYAFYGIRDFILCLGYKGDKIKEFFLNFRPFVQSFAITLGRPQEIEYFGSFEEAEWHVTLAETGEHTMTGGRLARVRPFLEGEDHFCLTYGDGVSDVNIQALIAHHQQTGKVGTITAVRVAGRFGELELDHDIVTAFNEKPAVTAGRINAGFMVFDNRRIWDYVENRDDLVLEQDVFSRLVQDRQLCVYRHGGFWQCMDTPREFELLNSLWNKGHAPWKVWS